MLWDFSFCRTAAPVSSAPKTKQGWLPSGLDKQWSQSPNQHPEMQVMTGTPQNKFVPEELSGTQIQRSKCIFGNSLSCGQLQWLESLLKHTDVSEPSSLWRPMFLTQVQEHIQSLDVPSWQIQPGLPSPTRPAAAGVRCVHPSAKKPFSKPTSHCQVCWRSCENQHTMELLNPVEHEAF